MAKHDNYESVTVTTRAAWRAWLARNHAAVPGIWLVTYKVGASKPRVAYDDIVEEALCFGWVDSVPRKLDAERSKLLCTPRKKASGWSAINKKRVAALIQSGQMTSAGMAKIEAAQEDGSWFALDEAERGTVPADLEKALAASKSAQKFWAGFPPGVRKQILQWIGTAKTNETRGRRVAETVALAARNERANQWRKKQG